MKIISDFYNAGMLFKIAMLLMLATFIAGDLITTVFFVEKYGINYESNIFARIVLANFGIIGIIVAKIIIAFLVFVLVCYYSNKFYFATIATAFQISILSAICVINNIVLIVKGYSIIKYSTILLILLIATSTIFFIELRLQQEKIKSPTIS